MAGSFDIFRKYQRTLLAAVAILAMLAFFVLPPFLQMAPTSGGPDPLVATWRDGGIREDELQRQVAMRVVLNQFLRDAMAASGRDPGDVRVLPEDEVDVVRTLLLAREAEANGIVIGNGGVNQFLAQWTNNMVRPEQLEALIAGRRFGQMPVTTADVFAALRTILAADRMRQFSFAGLSGDPPGVRWDIFRRLEQEAIVEVVPVVVESFAGDVPAPSESALLAFFDRFKESLPVDRSADPGFMEPRRISYDWLVANQAELQATAEKDVTDRQIEEFYEENKVRLYRVKDEPAAGADEAAGTPAASTGETKPVAEEKADAAAEQTREPASDAQRAEPKARVGRPSPFRLAAFRQPAAATAGKPEAAPDAAAPAAEPGTADESKDAANTPTAPATDGVEPLEKVRDDVRKRLAAAAVDRKIDGLFAAIMADVSGFARDLTRWKAESGSSATKPEPPNVDTIAAKQGLKAGHAVKRTVGDALREGEVGTSFQLAIDPQSPMGFRQAQWADLLFGQERPLWRPVETRDVPGNRYLTWKTDDLAAFVPEFAAVRADVERAWRIVEARPLARTVAEEVATSAAGGRTLADVVKDRPGTKLEAATVGPFSWLAKGSATRGSPPMLSRPEGLVMPGEAFMRAVFSLEPGSTAVTFNEPQTVCYVIRLVSYTPAVDDLRQKFLDPALDQQRIAAVAEREQAMAFESWLTGVEKRSGLEWKRPPQRR